MLKIQTPIVCFFMCLIAGCQYNSKEESFKLSDGMYHAKVKVMNASGKDANNFQVYAKIKDGFIIELDSEINKPILFGVFAPARIDPFSCMATIKTWSNQTYNIQVIDNDGYPWNYY